MYVRLAVAPTSREGLPAYGPPAEGPHTLTHTGCKCGAEGAVEVREVRYSLWENFSCAGASGSMTRAAAPRDHPSLDQREMQAANS